MRYTECRLARPAMALLDDIDKDTVGFQENYDGSEKEPVVLPARFPNLLVNGAGGIAVGMATNIPPHNLGEVVDAAVALIDNPALTIDELIKIVPGPDFPTGGIILGRDGIRSAYTDGRGSVVMRGKVEIETVRKEREAFIITEIPYQVNKATMVERIAELVREKKIDGVADLRDESDRQGYRVVVELKREAVPDVVLNQLYRFTPLQSSFSANMVALDGGRPLVMTLKDMLNAFIAFREEVVSRRTKHLLGKARDRAHVLVGLAIAVANIDEFIKLIRAAKDPNGGARGPDEARLAGQGCGGDGDADRRSAPQGLRQEHDKAFRRAGKGDSRPAPAAADRARPRRDQGRARQARRPKLPTISRSCARGRASRRSSRTNSQRLRRNSPPRAAP